MQEEFYAVIKLVSGEEIFSKVCPCEEEDRTILILDNPVIIESIALKQLGVSGVKITPWIKFTDDSMFIMDLEKVLTMSEVNDEDLLKLYDRYVKKNSKDVPRNKPSKTMGYLSSIDEARTSLEKIYRLNS